MNFMQLKVAIFSLTLYAFAAPFTMAQSMDDGLDTTTESGSYDTNSGDEVKPKATKRKGKKRGARKKRKKKTVQSSGVSATKTVAKADADDGAKVGIAFGGGYEAPYGNHVALHVLPVKFLDLHAGVGYNTSGLKLGAGSDLLLGLTSSFGLSVGGFFTYSAGREGEVPLEARFIRDDTGVEEPITATKVFNVNAAQLAGASVGFYFDFTDSIRFAAQGHYSSVLAGNEVSFDDEISFSKAYTINNQEQFDQEFQRRAEEQVAAGGVGASAGLQIFF